MSLVAVYGSLKAGFGNNLYLLGSASFKGKWVTPPVYTMYSLGGFPGVHEDGETAIHIEVYEVTEPELLRLNQLEGFREGEEDTNFYNRITIDTPYGDAFMYIYNSPCSPESIVVNGNWGVN